MDSHPVPNVTDAAVDRVVAREYPVEQRDRVGAVLRDYGSEEWHPEAMVHIPPSGDVPSPHAGCTVT